MLAGAAGVLAVAVVAPFLFSKKAMVQPAQPDDQQLTLYLSSAPGAHNVGLLLARDAGLFKRARLSVTIVTATDDQQAIRAVSDNANAIALVPAQAFLIARGMQMPAVAFSASFQESTVAFFTLKDLILKSASDFGGKAVAYRQGTDASSVYNAVLDRNVVSRFRGREVTADAGIDALVEGKVDILPGHLEDEAYRLRKAGVEFNLALPGRFGVHTLGTVFITNQRNLQYDQDLLVRFLQAAADGWQLAYRDTDAAFAAFVAQGGVGSDLALFKKAMDEQRPYIWPLGGRFGEFERQKLTDLQRRLVLQRLMSAPVDLDRAVSFEILRKVHRRNMPSAG